MALAVGSPASSGFWKGISMVGDASIEDWMDKEFGRARRRALLRRISAWLRRSGSRRLASFEEAKAELPGAEKVRLGKRRVRVEKIVGSVGRRADFDRDFLPTTSSGAERWKRVNRTYRKFGKLPPVSLYKVGGEHFVLDGNHRVSVARYHGEDSIEAEVVEFRPRRASGDNDGTRRAGATA